MASSQEAPIDTPGRILVDASGHPYGGVPRKLIASPGTLISEATCYYSWL